jgi:hypothetical protein
MLSETRSEAKSGIAGNRVLGDDIQHDQPDAFDLIIKVLQTIATISLQ